MYLSELKQEARSFQNLNLCIICFDWFQKSQVPQQSYSIPANYQELRVLLLTILAHVLELRELSTLKEQSEDLANQLSDSKHKLSEMESDIEGLEKKDEFSSKDTFFPDDGNELKVVKEALAEFHIDDFLRRRHCQSYKEKEFKVKIMKKKVVYVMWQTCFLSKE